MMSCSRLLSIYACLNQGGIIISIYDISLLQFLFCKKAVNLKERVAAIALLLQKNGNSLNGWLQLDLRINSIPLEIGMNARACLKETVPLKILEHCKWPSKIMVVPIKCMAASVPFHEIKKLCTLKKNCSLRLITVT